MTQTEIQVQSSLDGSMQPCLFYQSPSGGKRPLLVGLHTWSFDRFNQISNMLPYAEKMGFHLLLPEFRGPNLVSNPDCRNACASPLAVQDVLDAIGHVKSIAEVDEGAVLLLGLSGGGHMALMTAAAAPKLFCAVGAYVPITDLSRWAQENGGYRKHVLACCSDSEEEMLKRSPVTYIDRIAQANVKLFHGKFDPVVPVGHSIDFFREVLARYPKANVFLDVFDGGHEIDMQQAMYWLVSQYNKKEAVQVTG